MDWRQMPPQEAIEQALQRLQQGQVVAFPTDTVYVAVASVQATAAVQRLAVHTAPATALTMAMRNGVDAHSWVPEMSVVGQRLARRTWPGPVTLVFPGAAAVLESRLPAEVRQLVCPAEKIWLRCPAHEAIYHTVARAAEPLVFAPLVTAAGQPLTQAADLAQVAPEQADLILWDGDTYFGEPGPVVEVHGQDWTLLREGLLSAADVQRLACCQIVFVCTGNTCRSPMAEALCKKMLADRLGCTPDELPAHGFVVLSAGISAFLGGEAAPEAVEIARELGADLTNHRSRPLSADILDQADFIFTMTQGHLQMLQGLGRNFAANPQLLSHVGLDVDDPIGKERAVYQQCAQQILQLLEQRLPEFQRH
jgi:protein-tyrosine phosphatase